MTEDDLVKAAAEARAAYVLASALCGAAVIKRLMSKVEAVALIDSALLGMEMSGGPADIQAGARNLVKSTLRKLEALPDHPPLSERMERLEAAMRRSSDDGSSAEAEP